MVPSSFVRILFVFRATVGASYFTPDGLSIPFFNLGRGVQSRTATFTLTWTRTRTFPDWLLYVRRPEDGTALPTATVTDVDVERAMGNSGEAHSETAEGPEQKDNGPPSPKVVVPDAVADEIIINDRILGSGGGDEAIAPTQVCLGFVIAVDDPAEGPPCVVLFQVDSTKPDGTIPQPKLTRFPSVE